MSLDLSNLQFSPQQTIFLSISSFVLFFVFTVVFNIVNKKVNSFNDLIFFKIQTPFWLIIFLLSLIICLFLLYISEKNRKVPVLSANTQDLSIPQEKSSDNQNIWKRLADNKSDWDLTEMDKLSDGSYCPRIYKNNFVYRTLWFRQYVPVVFNQIQIRFSIKKSGEDEIESRGLIQFGDVYGEDYSVANLYLPFDKTRSVNFESYDSRSTKSNGLSFQDNAGSLPLPIKLGSKVTVTISTENVLDNTVTYQYHIAYIPDGETDSIPKDLQYLVKLPDSSPKQLLMKFGLGVFANSCLENIEYAISN